ncbi:MAG: SdpI family protein [Lachnospiraceae bacterium]|nr:SdpI family protein [Lachnospiraceae bacterium]
MEFWCFMLVFDLLIPFIMILCGRMMWKHPPKSINGIVGYRTRRSMLNSNTWQYAQEYCGRLWWKVGWVMLLPSVLLHIPFYGSSKNVVGVMGCILCTMQCIALIAPIYVTESALKKNFTDKGIRK